ncbi:hypothetical protein [Metasolibacillus meyeri]|uniref:hypothetical protein n=1 Tax=Metasolibacillus meyeri TaxID=1071052 RepID=UPI000D326631|nr:hypothetical protein [Metasolibacillus meyeri]
MTKFKIGEKVKFTEDFGEYTKGDVVEVTHLINDNHIKFKSEKGKGDCYTHRIQKILSKNQRITALENEVKRLDKFSEGLRGALTGALKRIESLEAKLVEKVAIVEKSANEQRAEMIEKAKGFVEKYSGVVTNNTTPYTTAAGSTTVKLFVNEEKKIITAIPHLVNTDYTVYADKKFAKCNPSDVFNEHIGKAIALGRALNLDVSEFENAVQPDELVIGMKVELLKQMKHPKNSPGSIKTICKEGIYLEGGPECAIDSRVAEFSKIINDTNAIYGGAN